MRWVALDKPAVDMPAEREAAKARQATKLAARGSSKNPQFVGLHMSVPRVSLGEGCYQVSIKKGRGGLL